MVTASPVLPSLEALNALAPVDAATALGPLFEGAPGFLARLAAARPFASWDALFEAARAIAHAMPEPEQVELVDAHPRLGAPRAGMSTHSLREQGLYEGAGRAGRAPAVEPDLGATLGRLNSAYEARYGFRYCVFVAGRPRAALIPDLEATLRHGPDRTSELNRALDAVIDIARSRSGR